MRVRLLQLVSIAALVAAWEAVARLGWVDAAFVPAPSAVAWALGGVSGPAFAGLADTLTKTAIAYAIAVVVGVGLGIAVGSVRLLRDVLNPFVIAAYGIPKILILPWIILLTGFGTTPAILYGTLHATFPIMLMVIGGVRDVDRTLITVARAYGATTWQLYWKVILPAIVPSVLAGMRLGHRLLPARRARGRDVRGHARDGLRDELPRERVQGARAVRGDRAGLRGVDRDRPRPGLPERSSLTLAFLSAVGLEHEHDDRAVLRP